MNHFLLNGQEIPILSAPGQSVQELVDEVRRRFNSENALISSIRVNGSELIGSVEEAALASLSVSQIDSLEVFTAHPRELAEETLQSLLDFTHHLEAFSRQAANSLETGQVTGDFIKLLDGVKTFTEAILSAKQILRVGSLEPLTMLETDLASIMKDLLQFQQTNQRSFVIDLMRNHLPLNLQDWRNEGIPTLIRSRDS
jgi:hypothetical protein